MNWTTSIRPIDDQEARARWNTLWASSPQRAPFSSLPFADAVSGALGVSCEMLLAGAKGHDEAGALVFWRRRGLYREVVVPPFVPLTPFVFREPPREAALHARRSAFEALLAALEPRFDRLAFHLHPTTQDVRVCRWRGWRTLPLYTYQLQLAAPSELQARWSGGTRRLYCKTRAHYRIEEAPAAAGEVVSLCAASYARQARRFPAPDRQVLALLTTLQQARLARIFTATPLDAGTPAGGCVVLTDRRMAYYWMAGGEPGAAMTVLLGEVLPRLHAEGFALFDFVGANTPSIAEFKRHFGPSLTLYFRIEKATSPTLRLRHRLIGS